jgi:phosphoribosyl 1,2-cyclic phosphodiesterase
VQRILDRGLDPLAVCGILISHEHGDHIRGARLCSQDMAAPIFATKGTIEGGKLSPLQANPIRCDERMDHEGFNITPIKVSHDTREPCAFLVEADGSRVLLATDIGTTQGLDLTQLKDLDFLYVEANHDEEMLKNGPYPYFLKKRIAGTGGHLNNRQSGELVRTLAGQSPNLRGIMLAHLSDKNNDSALALETVRKHAGAAESVRWEVARQDESVELK